MQKKKRIASVSKTKANQSNSVPYHRKPSDLSLEAWQIALRKQFVTERPFTIRKFDGHPVFGDYSVYNPETKNTYKVAFRHPEPGMNFCSCLDFKTNHLGTCKHIEAVLLQIQNTPRLASALKKGYTPPYTSVYLHYGKERKVKLRIGSDSSVKFKNMAWEYFDKEMTLTPFGYVNFEQFRLQACSIDPDFRCYDDAMEFILESREKQRRVKWIDERYPTGKELDGILHSKLFPYQQKGILFAVKAGRSMICDEMGLGKTVQAIGAAELLKSEQGISGALIICPTSLKYQWQSEIERFTGETAQVIEGLPHVRHSQYHSEAFYKIVSYHTLSHDINEINEVEFDLVVLDEAQRIKNWKTKIAQGVKKIKSPYALVLTGTPLENKLEELYSIVQFVDPFKLGPYYHFLDYYQVKNETGRVMGYRHLHEITGKLSDIMIRRSKKEVMSELPERMDKILHVSMTEKQMEMHTEFGDLVARLVNKWKHQGFLHEKDRQRLMINLNLMRMVCDSTYIVDQQSRHDTKISELMDILDEYLEEKTDKVVVFSQWERMTRLVAHELEARKIGYRCLTGSVPSRHRKELFDHFNNDPDCRVFLSTDAGSTGLNLQSASLIINLDIPWNPAVLEQRIGRVHRYGQKKKVSVINFVSTGTIEHRMIAVLTFKSSLFDGILNNGDDSIFMEEDKFREFMKTVESITTSGETTAPCAVNISGDIEAETEQLNAVKSSAPGSNLLEPEPVPIIPGDDDVLPADAEGTDSISGVPSNVPVSRHLAVVPEPSELIAKGLGFLNGLAQTFSSPEATRKLVTSLVDNDPATGKTYLKIPVENEKVVSDALTLVGQLFKAFGK
ncbi:MAG TPA: DEAD/DEAH box helicase [Bacteroidales bacterium]|nr:DEAD/DEAH box helicase [Bacteroidales bacterium]HPS61470.1 DEAD/DEAH box helicase [Bacteroidales bacterium]